MSQENVEIIGAIYDQYREGDFRASADLLDPHVILVLEKGGEWGLDPPEEGRFVGREAVAEYTRELLKPWTGFSMEAEEVVAAGDSVLVSVHQRGVGAISGVPAELRYFTVWSFRGHKVIRIESFRERHKALEAVGLAE
jgi:ketosteroid isomerase-like protein